MKKLHISEAWFQRSLWLVALIFAFFLIGLGNRIIGDLPRVQYDFDQTSFITDRARYDQIGTTISQMQAQRERLQNVRDKKQIDLQSAEADLTTGQGNFNDWLNARAITERNEQNPEVLTRARALEPLRQRVRQVKSQFEALDRQVLALDEQNRLLETQREAMLLEAQPLVERERARQEFNVFLYRLAFTLPLLLLAGWLWKRHRHSKYWPFVWGFIFFALFAFFIDLVPYLPNYGGYVRYAVGIIVTLIVGRQVIDSLNRYLDNRKAAAQLPETQRRQSINYDTALTHLAKGNCPSCERHLRLDDPSLDFCPHCGIGIHDYCGHCSARKSAFMRYCQVCGNDTVEGVPDLPPVASTTSASLTQP